MIRKILYIFLSFLVLLIIYMGVGRIYSEKVLSQVEYMNQPSGIITNMDGVKLHYVKKGEGPPLILIHGFLGSTDNFKKIAEPLSKEYTVYLIDNIGFGHSDKGTTLNYSRKSMADIIGQFLIRENLSGVNLLGHSMGGEVAINLVLDYPELIDKLILVSSTGIGSEPRFSQSSQFVKEISQFIIDNLIFTYPTMFISGNNVFYNKESLSKIRRYEYYASIKLTNGRTLLKLSEDSDSGNRVNEMENINVPVLLIWGSEDKVVDIETGYQLKEMINNSKLIVINKTGHLPFEEEPEEFINILTDFIS